MMRITTAEGRTYDVEAERVLLGRVVYRVAGVGAFTLEPDATREGRQYLHCVYGVHDHAARLYHYREPLPDAPVMFGITISGAAVYDPSRFVEGTPHGWAWPLPMQRATEGGVYAGEPPRRTRERVTDIVGALSMDYLQRPDLEEIEHDQAVRLAPGRLVTHQRNIDRLREEIAAREAELAVEMSLADAQLALVPSPLPEGRSA